MSPSIPLRPAEAVSRAEADATDAAGELAHSLRGPATKSAEPGQTPRSDFDLIRRLFHESTRLTAQDLIRHVDLNPRDAALTADDVAYLESIIATYRPDLAQQEARCGQVQSREMDALIAGGIAPTKVVQADASGRIRFRAELTSETMVIDVRDGMAKQYDAPFSAMPVTRHAMHEQAELCFQFGSTLAAYFASVGALTPAELAALEARLAAMLASILRM